jgi:hypothetical protein
MPKSPISGSASSGPDLKFEVPSFLQVTLAQPGLISFSLRIPKTLAASIEVTAKRLGVSKSEYARRG